MQTLTPPPIRTGKGKLVLFLGLAMLAGGLITCFINLRKADHLRDEIGRTERNRTVVPADPADMSATAQFKRSQYDLETSWLAAAKLQVSYDETVAGVSVGVAVVGLLLLLIARNRNWKRIWCPDCKRLIAVPKGRGFLTGKQKPNQCLQCKNEWQ